MRKISQNMWAKVNKQKKHFKSFSMCSPSCSESKLFSMIFLEKEVKYNDIFSYINLPLCILSPGKAALNHKMHSNVDEDRKICVLNFHGS